MELSFDPSLKELIEIGDRCIQNNLFNESIRQIGIRLSLTHPFMVEFVGILYCCLNYYKYTNIISMTPVILTSKITISLMWFGL